MPLMYAALLCVVFAVVMRWWVMHGVKRRLRQPVATVPNFGWLLLLSVASTVNFWLWLTGIVYAVLFLAGAVMDRWAEHLGSRTLEAMLKWMVTLEPFFSGTGDAVGVAFFATLGVLLINMGLRRVTALRSAFCKHVSEINAILEGGIRKLHGETPAMERARTTYEHLRQQYDEPLSSAAPAAAATGEGEVEAVLRGLRAEYIRLAALQWASVSTAGRPQSNPSGLMFLRRILRQSQQLITRTCLTLLMLSLVSLVASESYRRSQDNLREAQAAAVRQEWVVLGEQLAVAQDKEEITEEEVTEEDERAINALAREFEDDFLDELQSYHVRVAYDSPEARTIRRAAVATRIVDEFDAWKRAQTHHVKQGAEVGDTERRGGSSAAEPEIRDLARAAFRLYAERFDAQGPRTAVGYAYRNWLREKFASRGSSAWLALKESVSAGADPAVSERGAAADDFSSVLADLVGESMGHCVDALAPPSAHPAEPNE